MDAMPLTIAQEIDAALEKIEGLAKSCGGGPAFVDVIEHLVSAKNKIQVTRCELLGEMEKL